jgi:GNAT superfamily N-acetyltransferase
MVDVRAATPDDAEEAVETLRTSIRQLCVADHQNDPATLQRWLANKTPSVFREWRTDEANYLVIATMEGCICGVGLVRTTGILNLCYTRPGFQGRGVGKAILSALEERARQWGLSELRLLSTTNARPFYERHGFILEKSEPRPNSDIMMDYHYVKSGL